MILGFPGPVRNYAYGDSPRRMLEDGAGAVIAGDPDCTSRTCTGCNAIGAVNRTTQATFHCVACGHAGNAAVNIRCGGPAQLHGEGVAVGSR